MAFDTPPEAFTRASYRRSPAWRLLVVAVAVGAFSVASLGAGASLARAASAPQRASSGTSTPNSADRIIFWMGCDDLLALSDADLTRWQRDGVGGFSCNTRHLYGLGGGNQFKANLKALLGPSYSLERRLRDSRIAERAAARGMKLYLGMYLTNTNNFSTPLAEWFDDSAWTKSVLAQVHGLAAAAEALGFEGLAFDQELYPQTGNRRTASWDWDYPGNTNSEATVRAKVKSRGAELMTTILRAFPNAEFLVYGSHFPETWDELVQLEVNDVAHNYDNSVQIDLWNGMTSVNGYGAIRFINATFYKTMHVGGSWDNAYTYEYNRLFAMFSRRLSNWDAAADHIFESPFVWVSAGSTSFEAARSPSYVAEQLQAARRWGMGREFANYTYDNIRTFDYGPYLPGLREAAKPGVVDRERPKITVTKPGSATKGSVDLNGTATDNLAVRVVRWRTDGGASGAAEMNWVATGSPTEGWSWRMEWKAVGVPLRAGSNTIMLTVEDIKGLTTDKTITVAG